jgi:hypothetical protein
MYLKLKNYKATVITVVDRGTAYDTYGRASAQGKRHTGGDIAVHCWKFNKGNSSSVTNGV